MREKFGKLHLLLHSVAFAPREALEGSFLNTTREAFRVAHDVSAYSLVALARAAAPLMTEGGSIVAMTYYGSEKVVPHYNVMGVAKAALEASARYLAYDLGPKKIRVNCISAGPVNTLAARGIAGFSDMLKHYEAHAPLETQCPARRTGRHRDLSGQRRRRRHHRPGPLRGLRLRNHGDVIRNKCAPGLTIPRHPPTLMPYGMTTATIAIHRVAVDKILALRHKILREGLPPESACFDGDDAQTTFHFAAYASGSDGPLVGCLSFMLNSYGHEPAWQLRGMAVDSPHQRRGVGRRLHRPRRGGSGARGPGRLALVQCPCARRRLLPEARMGRRFGRLRNTHRRPARQNDQTIENVRFRARDH